MPALITGPPSDPNDPLLHGVREPRFEHRAHLPVRFRGPCEEDMVRPITRAIIQCGLAVSDTSAEMHLPRFRAPGPAFPIRSYMVS